MLDRLFRFLSRIARACNLVARWREQAALERALERQHQLAVITQITATLETLLDAQAKQNADTSTAVLALAASAGKNADAFGAWLQSFTASAAPTSSVVSEEDEYTAEQLRMAEKFGISPASLEDLPEEFALAFALRKDFEADVMRD